MAKKRLQVTLDEQTLSEIERAASDRGQSLSEFLRMSLAASKWLRDQVDEGKRLQVVETTEDGERVSNVELVGL